MDGTLRRSVLVLALLCVSPAAAAAPASPPLSAASRECLDCHEEATPGIVADWRKSRHARVTMREALSRPDRERRVSAAAAPEGTEGYAVGCAECHTRNPDTHPDSVPHGDFRVHPVVTPRDCAACHPVEATEFEGNRMAHAHGNLMRNPLFRELVDQVVGIWSLEGKELRRRDPGEGARADACLSCHGTVVQVAGTETRDTATAGEMKFPVLSGWPNQGVGRVNPDGSLGSCAACHTRHAFSIEVARKPETCGTCHKGPDVPAYPVWSVSKHGVIVKSQGQGFDFDAVPWVPGRDFAAPSCAACHASLLSDSGGRTLAPRTHRYSDRLAWRIFGLPYGHRPPASPDTTGLRSPDGLPLPTSLANTPSPGLIGEPEARDRERRLQGVCRSCHGESWVRGHFDRLHGVIEETNAQVLTATRLLQEAWKKGKALGPGRGSPFDEPIERTWVEAWLFHANSTRFAAAMSGADYGVFADGRWWLTRTLHRMREWLQNPAIHR